MAYPDRVVHRLHEAKLHERFPEATLEFLDVTIGEDAHVATGS